MPKDLMKLWVWFCDKNVPIFDKVCGGFLTLLAFCALVGVVVVYSIVMFTEPYACLMITLAVFFIISAGHMADKYL